LWFCCSRKKAAHGHWLLSTWVLASPPALPLPPLLPSPPPPTTTTTTVPLHLHVSNVWNNNLQLASEKKRRAVITC
jgi:hypothetical protein